MSERLSKKLNIFMIVTVISLIIDQVTKYWVRNTSSIKHNLQADGTHPYGCDGFDVIPGFFSITHRENPGAAFGLLSNLPETWRLAIFLGFTLIALFVILDMFRRLPKNDVFLSTTLGLVLSGAIGNAIDRIHQSTVTDFLRFYAAKGSSAYDWLNTHWPYMTEYPSFNVADSTLLVGVGMFLIHYLFLEEKEAEKAAEDLKAAAGSNSGAEELTQELDTQETEEVENQSNEA